MTHTRRWSICFALLVFAASGAVSGAAQTIARVSASDDYLLQLASDPQISPDGKEIVYVRQFADIMTDHRYSNLWIVAADGRQHRPLTTGNRSDASPRWSPDGTRLAYVAEVDGHAQIMVRWMDSGQTAQLTNLEEPPGNLSWSPDGTSIAFTALVPDKEPKVADLPLPPAGAKWAAPAKAYDQLVYRFNGAGYLKPGYSQIFVVSADGGTPRQVSHGDFQNGGWTVVRTRPVWTPDGQYLIASINRHPNYQLEPFDTDVYEIAVADGTTRPLTTRKGPDNDPVVSPDGKRIAYTGFDDRYQGYQVTRLYVMNRDGSSAHAVSEKLDRDVSNPAWAADGRGVYVKYEDQGDTKIGFFGNDGSFRTIAEHLASGTGSYDFGSSFSVAKSGAIAFTYGTPSVPGDVATVNRETATVLTGLNRDYLAQRKLGTVEEIRWPSSLDKREIHGYIIKPPDFDPAKKYPLILEIHGGPFAHYGDRFDLSKQAWASAGYVVLLTNPRGSTSYGAEFGNLIHHAYPGDDFHDLNSAVDAVIAKGYIDTNNLFVTGGSGGGVLTCWMIEHTDRFRAAAVLYPVINWYSFALTSDIPFITRYWFPGMPWDQAGHYMQRSLTTLVTKVKTPSLVMTGEEDYRTPISEAEQFYTALKLLNVETVLVRVPGEPHGLRRFPSHAAATSLMISGWFDSHKKAP
jgi:dipeptidyl aminopeptidase/acylaminoacyl peptidase